MTTERCDGSVVGSVPCVQKVAGLNPTLAASQGPLASPSLVVAYVVLRQVNSDTVSYLWDMVAHWLIQ